MHEVNFNENTNIEKNIKLINKKKNSGIKIVIPSIITTVSVFTLFELVPITTILEKGLIAIGSALLGTGVYMIVDSIDEFISNFKKEKARKNLKEISRTLAQNEIKTNTKELTNSLIINNNKKTTIETSEDDEKTTNIEEINDKYYLFLDNDSQVQGILQRNIITDNEEGNNIENKYYILEEPELKVLEPKITKVKKLVRIKDTEIEKQK